ncbi:CRTAC1 family protein [Dokdonella sp.]|uniref:CRTAC1 family protein n=1 Tax=Dokdonella sp. TaxID=2291710 RepID=UPI003C34BCD1
MTHCRPRFHQAVFITALALSANCVVAGSESETAAPATDKQTGTEFIDIAKQADLDFTHWNGMTGEHYFVEPVGSGGALFDADGDGDLDVYLVQGSLLNPVAGDAGPAKSVFPSPRKTGGRIYRNDLSVAANGKRQVHFTDVTAASGLKADGYGMGVATGDIDNDGRMDLYLTNFGPNQLWRNVSSNGRIRFESVAPGSSGLDDKRWSTSASFADFDKDGWLDLVAINYVKFRLENHKICRSPGGRPDYCGPQAYDGESDSIFRNRGDGTFVDASGPVGILDSASSGLGVVVADFDVDGWPDIYVANDLRRNFLWRNEGASSVVGQPAPMRFSNEGLERGVAVSMLGRSQASMGVIACDLDSDGDDDLFMTHLSGDTNTTYINDGQGFFADGSAGSGLGAPSLGVTGFGVAELDYDNDGWMDIMVGNGDVRVIESEARAGDPYPLRQPNQLFRNNHGKFIDASGEAGSVFGLSEVSRGLAVGDIDNDGLSDVLVVNNSGPVRLLHNRNRSGNAWLGLRLLLRKDGRDAIGAKVKATLGDDRVLWRRIATDGSYLSAGDPRVVFGLGSQKEPVLISVIWPDGQTEEWKGLALNRYHTLVAGQATKSERKPSR